MNNLSAGSDIPAITGCGAEVHFCGAEVHFCGAEVHFCGAEVH